VANRKFLRLSQRLLGWCDHGRTLARASSASTKTGSQAARFHVASNRIPFRGYFGINTVSMTCTMPLL
jgi:hypothetical protein